MLIIIKTLLLGVGCWLLVFLLTPYFGGFSILIPLVLLFIERLNNRTNWLIASMLITFALLDITTSNTIPFYFITTILASIFYIFALESAITSGHIWGKIISVLLWFMLWQIIFWLLHQLYQKEFLSLSYLFDYRWLVGIFSLWLIAYVGRKMVISLKSATKRRSTNLNYV